MSNLSEMAKLYELLYPHMPSEWEKMEVLDITSSMVGSMRNHAPEHFVDAMAIIYRTTVKEIVENLSPEQAFLSFAESLLEIKFFSFVFFVRGMING